MVLSWHQSFESLSQRVRPWFGPNWSTILPHENWELAAGVTQPEVWNDPDLSDFIAGSAQAVLAGEAASERDGSLSKKIDYQWEALASILSILTMTNSNARVLDVGGSLGSTFLQMRGFLPKSTVWRILETSAFAAKGRELFAENKNLDFFSALEKALENFVPDVVLISGSLQYFSAPEVLLDLLAETGAKGIVLDRTPTSRLPHNTLSVQRLTHSPRSQPRQAPMWIFSTRFFQDSLGPEFEVVETWQALDGVHFTRRGFRTEFRGGFFRRAELSSLH